MKIVIINNGLSGGGIERASTSMANAFLKLGFEVSVIALYKRERFFVLNNRINFIEPLFAKCNKYCYVLKMILYMRKNLSTIKPNFILAYGEWTNSYVIIATRFMGIPVYLSDRMSPTLNMGIFQNGIKKVTYRWANGIIAQTEYAKNYIYQRTKNKNIIVIPNPVNAIDKLACKSNKQIITIGRLTKEKGHKILLEAFSMITNREWQLIIVGDGTERKNLEEQAKELGIESRVIFAGHQKELSKYLSESEIFVLPSLSEGFPNALIEAMSVPLACISSNCVAGPSDIIRDGENGFLVSPNNSKTLASTIDQVINDDKLRTKVAQEAYKVRQYLDFDSIANKYLEFITK